VGDFTSIPRRRRARRRDHAGRQHAGGRRLAGAVGPEQAEDLARDDISLEPISDAEWERTLVALFMEMLNVPESHR
jgi:hypothetical protein